MDDSEMDRLLAEWTERQSVVERHDPLWGLNAYRLARYTLDLARADARALSPSMRETGDQLVRAIGSISANLAEGYSRPSIADRCRFYAYALGSAREAGVWYATLEDALSAEAALTRAEILARIRKLVFGMLRSARNRRGGRIFDR